MYTTSHIEFVGGSSKLWMAARYGRAQTSALLDQPPNIDVYRRLYPSDADVFDDEFGTRPVSHTVNEAAWLTESVCAVPVGGQQQENLVVLVPDADVLFAGAMATFGVTPNAFDGDPLAWADALGELGELASRIVPGIGPIGGPDDLVALQAYLYACAEAEGDVSRDPPGSVGPVGRSPFRRDQRRTRRHARPRRRRRAAVHAPPRRPGLTRPRFPLPFWLVKPVVYDGFHLPVGLGVGLGGWAATSSSLRSHSRRAACGSRAFLLGVWGLRRTKY